jgi:hypothetical protein
MSIEGVIHPVVSSDAMGVSERLIHFRNYGGGLSKRGASLDPAQSASIGDHQHSLYYFENNKSAHSLASLKCLPRPFGTTAAFRFERVLNVIDSHSILHLAIDFSWTHNHSKENLSASFFPKS